MWPLTPDQELVRQTLAGNLESFRLLVDRYRSKVYSLAYRLIGDKGEAEDMSQEAFLKVFRNLDKFDLQLSFSTWLYKIATNVCLSHLRRRRFFPAFQSEEQQLEHLAISETGNPAELLEQGEVSDLVKTALQSLPARCQLVMVLKYMNGLSYSEIAEVLKTSKENVETTLYRGRKLLARLLIEHFPEKRCLR